MSEDKFFNTIKTALEKQEKETIIEYLSTLLSKLVSNSVGVSVQLEPEYIEYADDNGILKIEFAQYKESPIRDTLSIDFSKHDENVRKEFGKEILKNIPSPPIKEDRP